MKIIKLLAILMILTSGVHYALRQYKPIYIATKTDRYWLQVFNNSNLNTGIAIKVNSIIIDTIILLGAADTLHPSERTYPLNLNNKDTLSIIAQRLNAITFNVSSFSLLSDTLK